MPLRVPPDAHATVVPILIAGVLMLGGRLEARTAEGQAARGTAIRSIQTAATGQSVVVRIEATGALPLPASGVIDGPPRIYLDFPGVALKAPGVIASADPRILRIRAGVHNTRPLVTRVVIDLALLQPYRVEGGDGRISVIVGEQVSPGIAPVAPLPERSPAVPAAREPAGAAPTVAREPDAALTRPPGPAPRVSPVTAPASERPPEKAPSPTPAPPRASPSLPQGSPLPPRDLERYKRQISPALDRLRLQQPLLASLDGAEEQTMDRVQLAVEEFERLRSDLLEVKPPETLRSQHDMLFQATTLALMATRLRLEAFRTTDPATLRNVASAAAGATLLLARACADLGCPER